MTLKQDIDALQQAALSVEDQLRKSGHYSRDCKPQSLDAAIRRGKKTGVALLFDEHGEMEVVDLNGGAEHIEVSHEGQHVTVAHNFEGWHNPRKEHKEPQPIESTPAYTQVNEHSFPAMAAESHKRANAAGGKFPPVNMAGDAARRAKQTADAANERTYRAAAMQRNQEIAAQQKAFWK